MTDAKDSLCDIKRDVDTILKRLGGATKTARMFQIADAAVQQWKKNGLPQARRMHLLATRPDVLAGTRYEEQAEDV